MKKRREIVVKVNSLNHMAVLQIDGEITIKNIEQFRSVMEAFISKEAKGYILDLSNVSYVNSSALGQIADGVMKLKKVHKELVIAGIQPNIAEIFEIVKFESFIKLFANVDNAMQYFEQHKIDKD